MEQANQDLIVTLVRNTEEGRAVRRLLDSIRDFGGNSDRPIWLYCADFSLLPDGVADATGVDLRPLPPAPPYLFADKVVACADAEADAARFASLIWIDPVCLVLQPPSAFHLAPPTRAAVRPVHIRNIGLPSDAPLDDFWRRVYAEVGTPDPARTVETFIGGETIRPYFNTHAFAVTPAAGLMGRWWALFSALLADHRFQETACVDDLHRIFLHQAVFSALLATAVPSAQLRLLPPTYNYPYNLQERVPAHRRAARMDDLVLLAVEGRSLHPAAISDIGMSPALRDWLQKYI